MPFVLAAVVVGVASFIERLVLAGLDATPDPETEGGLSFPAEHVHAIPTPDGGRLHAEECGSGRPVVLLHGHGANLGIFAPLATRLAAGGRRVIAVDHRGFGRSTPVPSGFAFAGLVDDLATVLDELDLRDVTLVGHSMGGAVALGLAVDRPDVIARRVSAIVVVNGAARGPADRPLPRLKAAALEWSVTERVGRHPRHGLVLSRASFGAHPRRSHVLATRAVGLASPVDRRRGLTRRLLGIDLGDRLARVDVPVLVLAGERDRVLPPAESERIAEAIDGAALEVFRGAGHMLPLERVPDLADRILRLVVDDTGRPRDQA